MPHFIIHCSKNIVQQHDPEIIMHTIFDIAESTQLFEKKNIKVRIDPFEYYNTAGTKDDFLHIFGNIMEGRTQEQKKDLSERMVRKLKEMFPDVPVISMNIRDFEKSSYCNRSMV